MTTSFLALPPVEQKLFFANRKIQRLTEALANTKPPKANAYSMHYTHHELGSLTIHYSSDEDGACVDAVYLYSVDITGRMTEEEINAIAKACDADDAERCNESNLNFEIERKYG